MKYKLISGFVLSTMLFTSPVWAESKLSKEQILTSELAENIVIGSNGDCSNVDSMAEEFYKYTSPNIAAKIDVDMTDGVFYLELDFEKLEKLLDFVVSMVKQEMLSMECEVEIVAVERQDNGDILVKSKERAESFDPQGVKQPTQLSQTKTLLTVEDGEPKIIEITSDAVYE